MVYKSSFKNKFNIIYSSVAIFFIFFLFIELKIKWNLINKFIIIKEKLIKDSNFNKVL